MNHFKYKIFRNEYNKSIAGVASGLAESFDIDVTVIRLIFVLSAIFIPTSGLIVYIILWMIAPVNHQPLQQDAQNDFYKFNQNFNQKNQPSPETKETKTESKPKNPWEYNYNYKYNYDHSAFTPKGNFKNRHKSSGKLIFGIIFIVIGLQILLNKFYLFNIFDYMEKLWPIVLIFVGVFLLLRYRDQNKVQETISSKTDATTPKVEEAVVVEPTENDNQPNS